MTLTSSIPLKALGWAGRHRTGVALWRLVARSHGRQRGWLASAVDLVRFACAFDVPGACPVLRPESIALMFAPPPGAPGHDGRGVPKSVYYGCGWSVRMLRPARTLDTWHTGSLDGTSTLLMRRHDGIDVAVLFNSRSARDGRRLSDVIKPTLEEALGGVSRWPGKDLFGALL
jgi:hypothetical protein